MGGHPLVTLYPPSPSVHWLHSNENETYPNPAFNPNEENTGNNQQTMFVFQTWAQEDIKKAIEGIADHKMQTEEFLSQLRQLRVMYHLNGYEI